jgi:hypothetical protein
VQDVAQRAPRCILSFERPAALGAVVTWGEARRNERCAQRRVNLTLAHEEAKRLGAKDVDTSFDTAAEAGACSASGVVGHLGAQPLGGTAMACISDGDFPSAMAISDEIPA